jgi:hypothetical protein
MTRRMTIGALGALGALAAAALAACTAPAASPAPTGESALVLGGGDTCLDCDTCPLECSDEAAWVCPSGECNLLGACACDPVYAAFDCPTTGCCEAMVDDDGVVLVDEVGAVVYGCVVPACLTDDDCLDGSVCLVGLTCGTTACGCPDGYGPDPEQPCCLVTNDFDTCCESGEVDAESGLCVCTDPLMVDEGGGCQCPVGMSPEGPDGACICDDPDAVFDPELAECVCGPGATLDVDPYTGHESCLGPDEPPLPCADPHAVIDPDTGECVCEPGFVLGDTAETVSGQCVPWTCGDDVCGADETCDLCSYDCGECDDAEPDAALPDADPEDAAPEDADPPDAEDAEPPGDASPAVDASAPVPHDAACVPTPGPAGLLCHVDHVP